MKLDFLLPKWIQVFFHQRVTARLFEKCRRGRADGRCKVAIVSERKKATTASFLKLGIKRSDGGD
jgi:hypothetical protein